MSAMQRAGDLIARAALEHARDCANAARLREAMPSEFEMGMVAGQIAAAVGVSGGETILTQAAQNESRFLLFRYWNTRAS